MAKNFVFSGKRIHVKGLSAAVSSGSLCRRAGYVGIPQTHAPAGGTVAFALEGVWGMTFAGFGEVQPPVGTILYWDTTASALSIGSANDDYASVKVVTAVNASTGAFQGLLLPQGKPVGQDQS